MESIRLLLSAIFLALGQTMSAQQDLTSLIGGADLDSDSSSDYWYIEGVDGNVIGTAILQRDTWSGRGNNDGSNMTTPFMEYWENKGYHTDDNGSNLPQANIRHTQIKGLQSGKYIISMLVRCYAETYSGYAPPAGVTLYANGVETDDICDVNTLTAYSGGAYTLANPQVEFYVDESGTIDFGINVKDYAATSEISWVAWKNIKLTYLGDGKLQAGDYYVRNRATGLFLQAGGLWGTQLMQGEHGLLITATKSSEEMFFLSSELFNSDNQSSNIGILESEQVVYMGYQRQTWNIKKNEEGFYTIYNSNHGYLGNSDETGQQVNIELTDPESYDAQWEFIPRNERILRLVDGTETDATFLISNPRYDPNFANSNWDGDPTLGGGPTDTQTRTDNQCAEAWYRNFNVSQTLSNIPNGTYKLSVQGFFRFNDRSSNANTRAINTHFIGGEKLYAKLFAVSADNEVNSSLQSIASESDLIDVTVYGNSVTINQDNLPFSMTEAGRYFQQGYYSDNSLIIGVTDHNLTIGIKKEQCDGADWTIWDNFQLELLAIGDNDDYEVGGDIDDIPFDEASEDNPVDCTSLIENPDFSTSGGWTGTLKRSGSGSNAIAAYGGTGTAKVTFNIYQTITGLPDGWYRLRAQGFYRYGDVKTEEHNSYGGDNENANNDVWAMYTIPYAIQTHKHGTERLLAKLFANNFETGLPSIFDGTHQTATHSDDYQTEFGWVPDSWYGATEAFQSGEYETELRVAVTGGNLTLGVRKPTNGYKYDWTCFDNIRLEYLGKENLVYATDVTTDATSLNLAVGEKYMINAYLVPEDASVASFTWISANTSVATVSDGLVTAVGTGTTTIYVYSGDDRAVKEIPVTVASVNGNPNNLIINEIQVSNIDMFIDPSNNYGGFVELYNPSNQAISLRNIYVTDDPTNTTKFRLNTDSGIVPANGFANVWFDHSSGETGNYRGNVNFKLNMDGGTIALYYGSTLIASQDYPAAVARTSYARTTDGGNTWGVTAYPTPAASNNASKEILIEGAERVEAPTATPGTGFYSGSVRPVITGEGNVYCTIDGTVPTEENGILAEDLTELTLPTVLRLRAFQDGKLPSEVVTYTYAENKYNHTLPVLMVTANPNDLYSDEMGIFVTGTKGVSGAGIEYPCNWNLDWDRSANMEYLSSEGESLFRQDVNIARFGGWSKSWIPYNFKIKAQKQYEGNNYLFYPFFTENKPYLKHKTLQVRNGGNDVNCRIKDAALHNIIISSGFYLDCLDYQPVHCYINGDYYGMQNLREPSNKHFALADYGIDTDEVDAMEITWGIDVKAGSSDSFYQWQSLSSSAADDETYRQICELVDVEEFANYMTAEIYLGGDDWPGNNCKGFKGNDGKFHIVLFDVDQALRFDTNSFNRLSSNRTPLINIFYNMMGNATFRKLFIDSFCIFGGSVMTPERCTDIIDRISQEMNPALQLEGLSTSPTAEYMKQVLTATRQQTMIDALTSFSYAQLTGTRAYKVSLQANIEQARLQVNGINVPLAKFNGTLFAPAIITAAAPQGFSFKGWKGPDGEWLATNETFNLAALSSSEALTTVFDITAVYEPLENDAALRNALAMPIKVNEVSAGNSIFASETWQRSDWVELYNTTDTDLDVDGLYLSDDTDQPMKYQIVKKSPMCNTIVPAHGYITVWADGLETTAQQSQIHAKFKLSNSDDQIVVALAGDAFINNNPEYFNLHPEMQTFIDGLSYSAHRGDETVGRFPDGGKYFYKMARPTIERTNTLLTSDQKTGEDQSLLSMLPDGFSIELAKGWNWMSHCLETPVDVDDLPNNAYNILSQTQEARRVNSNFNGNLKKLAAGNLYKIQMNDDDIFSSSRNVCDSNLPITLKPGWNWIGYTVSGMQTLDNAFERYLTEEGDMIVGQDGIATYDGSEWTGSLTSVETGKGYMFYSSRAKSLRFRAPEQGVNIRRNQIKNSMSKRFGFDKHAYPDVMGVIATLQQADTIANDGRYTILAYCNGECRGAGTWVDGRIFITIYGNTADHINFAAYDEIEGVAYPVVEKFDFDADVKGTLNAPKVLTIDEGDATDIADILNGTIPHLAIEGYFNLNGTLMGKNRETLPRGIYIVRYADGAFGKIFVKGGSIN